MTKKIHPLQSHKKKVNYGAIAALFLGVCLVVLGEYLYSGYEGGFNYGLACLSIGLAIVIIAFSENERLSTRKLNIAGAIALAIGIYELPAFVPSSQVHAELEIGSPDETTSPENIKKGKPKNAALIYRSHYIKGKLSGNPYKHVFEFTIPIDEIQYIRNTTCPTIRIEFEHDRPVVRSFLNDNVLSPFPGDLFDFIFDMRRQDLFFYRNSTSGRLVECDSDTAKEIQKAKKDLNFERDVSNTKTEDTRQQSAPVNAPATQLPPASDEHQITVSVKPKKLDTPISKSVLDDKQEPEKPIASHILGYVIYSQLNSDSAAVENQFFRTEGDPLSHVPTPNQKITLQTEKAVVRREPFHWNIATQSHVVSLPAAEMTQGQTAIVAGDSIVSRDETRNNSYYVITPISEIVGSTATASADLYPPRDLPNGVDGFVYLGYFDGQHPNLADKSFDNYSSPNSVYPAPNDVLVARSDIFFRKGPRHWDFTTKSYLMPPIVGTIKKGDYVKVVGDIVLTGKGVAYWAPVNPIPKPMLIKETDTSTLDKVTKSIKNFFR